MSTHLNANASLDSNTNANANAIFQERIQMQMFWGHIQIKCKCTHTVRTSSHVTDLMSSVAVDAQVCEQQGGAGSSRDRSAARAAAATSLGRSGVSATPTGCRDRASATVLRTPGMWSTRNRYRSDFSSRGVLGPFSIRQSSLMS